MGVIPLPLKPVEQEGLERSASILRAAIGSLKLTSPGNADLSDEAAGVSNDGAKSENADIAASAGNGNAERQLVRHSLGDVGTPNAFLSPPTSGTLFDVLISRKSGNQESKV
jgi:hypothetical protein